MIVVTNRIPVAPGWEEKLRVRAPSEGDLADVRRALSARSAFGRSTERRLGRAE